MSHSSSDRADERIGRAALPDHEYHRLLASDRRRVVLDVLEGRPGPTDLAELARLVAEREESAATPRPESVGRVELTLHHNHLPRLDDAGVIEYRPGAKRVEWVRGLVR